MRRLLSTTLTAFALSCSGPDPGLASERAATHDAGVGRADAALHAASRTTVPALVFHSLCVPTCVANDPYGIPPAELRRILSALQASGYTTVTSAEVARFVRGDTTGLPERPVHVTFDDGRLDAYVGADDVLRDTGARATMYVITAETGEPTFMTWADVATAHASGRWDIQLHADHAHTRLVVGEDELGMRVVAPAYANRRWNPLAYPAHGHLEPHAAWRARVEADLDAGIDLLRAHLPGFEPISFAVPFGDYGQAATNDPTIPAELRAIFAARFALFYTQSPPAQPGPTEPPTTERFRYAIHADTTAETVAAWLASRK